MFVRRLQAALLALFVALLLATGVHAQDAPEPMPRPTDRLPEGVAPPPGVATEPAPIEAPATGETAIAATQAVVSTPQPVTLTAQITEDGAVIPDGIVWRVFDTEVDASGELALAAKSDDATARLNLPPGEYVVHVAYGRAQASDTLTVAEGENNKSVILDAGALRLNAAITGDVPIPINLLKFDIYNGGGESEQTVIAHDVAPNDVVTLNAGTYHVVSHFGTINAEVRADLRVEPGQLTDATLYHHAAQVAFRLVSEPGGEAIADVEWKVTTPDNTTVFTDLGAFPATVLAEGDYVVFAKLGDQVFNHEFQVRPGPASEIEVLTAVY